MVQKSKYASKNATNVNMLHKSKSFKQMTTNFTCPYVQDFTLKNPSIKFNKLMMMFKECSRSSSCWSYKGRVGVRSSYIFFGHPNIQWVLFFYLIINGINVNIYPPLIINIIKFHIHSTFVNSIKNVKHL
jgi:hypothetical protein